jgi:hypothetical protein
MYCTHCECASCKALRIVSGGYDRVKEDVIRLIIKSGDQGMTAAELYRFSRPFRTIDDGARGLMLDQMVEAGILLKHKFENKVGRGKSREAFICLEVSQ